MNPTIIYTSWTSAPGPDMGFGEPPQYRLCSYQDPHGVWFGYYEDKHSGNLDGKVAPIGDEATMMQELLLFETRSDGFREFLENNALTRQELTTPQKMAKTLVDYTLNILRNNIRDTTSYQEKMANAKKLYHHHVTLRFLRSAGQQRHILQSVCEPQ